MANGFTPSLADLVMAWVLGFHPNALAELGIPWEPIVLGPGAWAPTILDVDTCSSWNGAWARAFSGLSLGLGTAAPVGLAAEHGAGTRSPVLGCHTVTGLTGG
jgi:hypothetical protein